MKNKKEKSNNPAPEKCPHCGHSLSPWQQVLLNVDRALVCKNCWYRIILDPFEEEDGENSNESNNSGENKE